MKKVLGYILMFFTVFVFVVGMGAEPCESTGIAGFLLFKASAAAITAALYGTLKKTGLMKCITEKREDHE